METEDIVGAIVCGFVVLVAVVNMALIYSGRGPYDRDDAPPGLAIFVILAFGGMPMLAAFFGMLLGALLQWWGGAGPLWASLAVGFGFAALALAAVLTGRPTFMIPPWVRTSWPGAMELDRRRAQAAKARDAG